MADIIEAAFIALLYLGLARLVFAGLWRFTCGEHRSRARIVFASTIWVLTELVFLLGTLGLALYFEHDVQTSVCEATAFIDTAREKCGAFEPFGEDFNEMVVRLSFLWLPGPIFIYFGLKEVPDM